MLNKRISDQELIELRDELYSTDNSRLAASFDEEIERRSLKVDYDQNGNFTYCKDR